MPDCLSVFPTLIQSYHAANLKLAMVGNHQMLQSSNFLESQVANTSGHNTAHRLFYRQEKVMGPAENTFLLQVAVRQSLGKILAC